MPIESFVTTLIDWTFSLMTRTKLAFVGFVAARNCMRQRVLDDAKSLSNCGRSKSATTCDSSYASNTAQYFSVLRSTTPVLLQYYFVPRSTTPYYKVLLSTSLYSKVRLRATKYMILMMNPRHMWNVINTEWSKRYQPPCPCHAKRISWLIRITYETSFTMRGARGVTHQILRRETDATLQPHQLYYAWHEKRCSKISEKSS